MMQIGCSVRIPHPQITLKKKCYVVNMKENKVSPSFDLFSGYFWEFWGQIGVLGDWLMLNII